MTAPAENTRIVPPTGYSARLTVLTSAAMAFLAVFALALSLAAGRVATVWEDALARSSTIRVSAPAGEMAPQTEAVLRVLEQTPGVTAARAMTDDEQRALLSPWFGPDLALDDLPIPRLIEISESETGYDAEGLRQRLAAEAPGAVLDDHARWRRPLVEAATRLRILGWVALALILGSTAALITLAAGAALAANEQVIRTLRLIGAKDSFIAGAFVRRFTLRAAVGAGIGMLAGLAAVAAVPATGLTEGMPTGIRFSGAEWAWPLVIPALAAATAFLATRAAAGRTLKGTQ